MLQERRRAPAPAASPTPRRAPAARSAAAAAAAAKGGHATHRLGLHVDGVPLHLRAIELEHRAAVLYQDAIPCRFAGMPMVNAGPIVRAMLKLCKFFLKKKIADALKGAGKELAEKAKAEAEALADAAPAGSPVVALLSTEADAKALEGAVNAVVAKRPAEACMLIGAGKTLAALAVVPHALAA